MAKQYDNTKPFRTEQNKKYRKVNFNNRIFFSGLILDYVNYYEDLSEQDRLKFDNFFVRTLGYLYNQGFNNIDQIQKLVVNLLGDRYDNSIFDYIENKFNTYKSSKK